MNLKTEKYYQKKGFSIVIGIDEVGRGPLAGSVVVSAVYVNFKNIYQSKFSNKLNKKFQEIIKITKDSKKLSEKQREKIFKLIKKSNFISFTYASINNDIIDKINIENATKLAIAKCLKNLLLKINKQKIIILIDGNKIIDKNLKIPQKAIIKGDNKIFSIALASIIAKVIRDNKMKKFAKKFPQYKFDIHKGYPTKEHKELLNKYGPCQIHRKSYKL